MRVLICGDRHWGDVDKILEEIAYLAILYGDKLVIIEGEAPGADTIARVICQEYDISYEPYPADWEKYKAAAGPIRNKVMLDRGKPDEVIAFHSNIESSKGTKNMLEQAYKRGISTRIVK
jgi:YspA, cpYpsA-related SLOG family